MIKNLVNSGIHANSIVFSPEGENLVGFKNESNVEVWGFQSGEKIKKLYFNKMQDFAQNFD